MKYPGNELELFDKAKVWRKYIYFKTKKYFKGKFLEIGAGIGSFTRNYESNFEVNRKISFFIRDVYNFFKSDPPLTPEADA